MFGRQRQSLVENGYSFASMYYKGQRLPTAMRAREPLSQPGVSTNEMQLVNEQFENLAKGVLRSGEYPNCGDGADRDRTCERK